MAREVLLPYASMAELDPTGEKPRQKKKSAAPKPKRRARLAPRGQASAAKKPLPNDQPVVMGRMERTRRLLLAALRVWELKRRPLE